MKLLRTVRADLSVRGMKAIIEIHKEFQAWEHKQVIEAAGPDMAWTYLDTSNPVVMLEHPMTRLETMAPYMCSAHLRDSIIYEHPR